MKGSLAFESLRGGVGRFPFGAFGWAVLSHAENGRK